MLLTLLASFLTDNTTLTSSASFLYDESFTYSQVNYSLSNETYLHTNNETGTPHVTVASTHAFQAVVIHTHYNVHVAAVICAVYI